MKKLELDALQRKAEIFAHVDLSISGILRTLGSIAAQQAKALDPSSYHTLDFRLRSGDELHIPIIPEVWIQILPSCRITLARTEHHATVYLLDVQGFARLPWHSHIGQETIQVLRGTMTDRKTGRLYRSGEIWDIPAGSEHGADLENALLCIAYAPPLPTAAQRPVDLSAIHTVFEAEEA
jgi:quercetin dioxygenase-like cupin family protein